MWLQMQFSVLNDQSKKAERLEPSDPKVTMLNEDPPKTNTYRFLNYLFYVIPHEYPGVSRVL